MLNDEEDNDFDDAPVDPLDAVEEVDVDDDVGVVVL